MKRIFIAVLLTAIVTNLPKAQNTGINISTIEKDTADSFYESPVTDIKGSPAVITEVNVKAARDFLTNCKKAENPHWYIDTKGTCVYYFVNGNKARRFYDNKGDFIYEILSYPEEYLPYHVRDLIKTVYYFDYKIIVAKEII
jgi:hypothetical protein